MVEKYIETEEKKILSENSYNFEKCFLPIKDEGLMKRGVDVCAITEVRNSNVKNRLIFRRGRKQTQIECIHSAICQLEPNPESQSGFETVVSTEAQPKLKELLAPEEHYWMIKSFTQALVERGIQNSLIESIERKEQFGKEPFDFNALMRKQMTRALVQIAPEETKDLALEELIRISAGDPQRLNLFSSEFKEIICDFFDEKDVEKLSQLKGGLKSLGTSIRQCLAVKENLPKEFIPLFLNDPDYRVRTAAAERNDLSTEQILQLGKDKNQYVREEISTKKNLPFELIEDLAFDDNPVIKRNIIKNENIPNSLLIKFANDPHLVIRQSLSRKKDLPNEALILLSNDKSKEVRENISQRKILPDFAIEKLAFDKDDIVRSYIAQKDNLSPEIINALSHDSYWLVRYRLAERTDLPIEVIETLENDENHKVRRIIALQKKHIRI